MAIVDDARPLEPLDFPAPEPGPGQALVRVLYCGVCYSDVKTAIGHMPFSSSLRLPHVPGHEIAGEVVAVGPGATLREGQRVVVYNYWGCGDCRNCRAGRENLRMNLQGWVGFTSSGGFEEYLAVPQSHLLLLPDMIPAEQAAALSCATGTSYRAVVTRGRVAPGETVLVVGVGGVGIHCVQLARAAGARVLAVDLKLEQLERARMCGATAVARGRSGRQLGAGADGRGGRRRGDRRGR